MARSTVSNAVGTVDQYLSVLPAAQKVLLQNLRKTIKESAPEAEELISYQIPTYKYHGPLVHFAAFENHCSLIVVSKTVMDHFKNELGAFKTSGRTVHFHAAQPLPEKLVKAILKMRLKENEMLAASKKIKTSKASKKK
jgi:uncharacterized protein YdhG (YjbR/CyaY superfamily)